MTRTARVHRGPVRHCWDHCVIALRDGDRETAFLSLYAIAYSATLGGGHVALLEVEVEDAGTPIIAALTDREELGRQMQERLRSMGFERRSVEAPISIACFERDPSSPSGFGFRIRGEGLDLHARWEETSAPEWVDGSEGGLSMEEDIWALMVEARRAPIILNGREASGDPFEEQAWRAKLGRPLSSAHAAFAEVRLARGAEVSDRARGSDPDGPR